jgi:flagellar biosynthesis anti-sigma factor FlgM
MKLSDIYQKINSMPYVNQGEKSNGSDKKRISSDLERQPSPVDKVEFSNQSKVLQKIQNVLETTPEVRTEKVIAARKALADGRLRINSEAISDKMIKNSISELKNT